MNTLLNSTANAATSATRFADEARASAARAQSAKAEVSGQFSQMLRGYDKPADSPKPAAEASTANAKPALPKAEGKTEMQQQEARSAAPKKSAEAAAKAAAEPAAATSTAALPADVSDAAGATASTSKSTEDEVAAKEAAASPDSAMAARLAPPTPLPLPLPLALPTGAAALAKPRDSEDAADDHAEPDNGKASAKTNISTPTGRAAQAAAAADEVKANSSDPSSKSSASEFATALADAVQAQPAAIRSSESGPHVHREGVAVNGIAGAQALQNAAAAASADTSGPAAARVNVVSPLYTPGFAPEMAARLSVLTADGVQTAQLHLNPADMGPVMVQIVVEGQQARIEFQADQADTRAVLERSLPDLAAALRDAGLTLSGGGVFQQFAGQDQSGAQARSDGSDAPRRRSSRDLSEPLAALPARVAAAARPTQGVVDLYA